MPRCFKHNFLELSCRIRRSGDVMLLNMSETDLELLAHYARHHAEDAFAAAIVGTQEIIALAEKTSDSTTSLSEK